MRRICVCRTYAGDPANVRPCSIRRESWLCWISLLVSAISRAVAYSKTTDCRVKLPGCCPRSISERRRNASTASSTVARGRGVPRTLSSSSRLTGWRRMANHRSTRCSTAERRANCSSSNSRTLPKTTSPCFRKGAISPPKSSTMVCATIFKARGFPAYASINCICSAGSPMTSFSANNCLHALTSNRVRRKARTGDRRPSIGTRSTGFSRLVSSRQL